MIGSTLATPGPATSPVCRHGSDLGRGRASAWAVAVVTWTKVSSFLSPRMPCGRKITRSMSATPTRMKRSVAAWMFEMNGSIPASTSAGSRLPRNVMHHPEEDRTEHRSEDGRGATEQQRGPDEERQARSRRRRAAPPRAARRRCRRRGDRTTTEHRAPASCSENTFLPRARTASSSSRMPLSTRPHGLRMSAHTSQAASADDDEAEDAHPPAGLVVASTGPKP